MKISLPGLLLAAALFTTSSFAADPVESDYYAITSIPVPDGVVLEVSGIDLLPDKTIAVSSRRGEVWLVKNAYETPAKNTQWTRFASGLHEPLGISWKDGWLYATQRPGVIRMKDLDGDGRADLFETINNDWGINGDYHEYAFGSRHDKDGSIWAVLCLTGSSGAGSAFRGWCVRITKSGDLVPTASGIRSPGGIGANHLGDMFYSDNQGLWNGSSCMKHLKVGSFTGNPTGNKFYDLPPAKKHMGERPPDPKNKSRYDTERKRIPQLVPPSIVFPHNKMGKSTSGITYDSSKGKFGPFANQMLVQDQSFSNIARVDLEMVNGVYQGAAFIFRQGFGSGNLVGRMAPDGSLFVGGTNRGWGSKGRAPFALERLNWTGKTPFEVHEMNIRPDGFRLTFTEPVDPETARNLNSYEMKTYTYIYQSGYGSPEVDHSVPKVTAVALGKDNRSAVLKVDGLVKGHVHELHMKGIRSATGLPLLHQAAYYTLNEIPKR